MSTIITPAPAYQRPSGKLYLGTDQLNLVDGAVTLVEVDTIATGFTDGIENAAAHRITPGQAGYYNITAAVTFKNVVANKSYTFFVHHSTLTYLLWNTRWTPGTENLSLSGSALTKLSASDFLRVFVRSHSGNNTVDIKAGQSFTFLSIQRVR